MSHRGPLITAVVVVGGLVGLMTANSAGGLVTAGSTTQDQPRVETTSEPPVTTEPPAPTESSEAPAETTAPPAEEPPPAAALPAEAVYAGKAATGPLAIAVAVKGEEASAYLCDGANVESWLKGTAIDGTVELASKDGVTTLTAGLDGDALAGTIMIAGQPQEFSITIAPPPAGLYRGEGGETTVGWIILPDGTQVGIAKSPAGIGPAPALDPAKGAAMVGGARVAAAKVTGETTFG